MFEAAIAARALGAYPVSIATSLALESANGVHPEIIVESPPILKYQELWVNVRTVFRNFVGALDKETAKGVTSIELAGPISDEMDAISSIIHDSTSGQAKVVYYLSNYSRMARDYPFATLRMDSTPNQKAYTALQTGALELLLKQFRHGDIAVFEMKLQPQHRPRAMLLTHYAYDLLSHPNFSDLVLLESHTGKIKERAQWYTKYHEGKNLSMIPFREDFIQVFGDSETFRPADPKLRKAIIEVAEKYNWTAVTTRDKLLYGIEQIQNPYYVAVLKQLMLKA